MDFVRLTSVLPKAIATHTSRVVGGSIFAPFLDDHRQLKSPATRMVEIRPKEFLNRVVAK